MIISKKDFYSQQSTGFKNNQNEVPSDDMPVSANLLSDGHYYILSRFADDVWRLPDSAFPQNRSEYEKKISFKQIPLQFRATLKIIILKYLLFGLAGSKKPSGGTVFSFFKRASLFLNYLDSININSLSAVTELICANYTHHCSQIINKNTGKKLASNTLSTRFNSLEALYKLSQNTVDVMAHPWPDSSSAIISGITKKIKTKIIPDEILSQLFNAAMDKINEASKLLELRDGVDQIKKKIQNIHHL